MEYKGSGFMDFGRINKVLEYTSNSISKASKVNRQEECNEVINKDELSLEKKKSIDVQENYGSERYLICNPNMLYRYVSKSFVDKSNYKVNKAAYKEAAKRYGKRRFKKKNYFEESYI